MKNIEQNIESIISLYEKHGSSDYIGEHMSQTEHMIRTAMLAEQDNKNITLILACFLHDIGHLLEFENENNLETMDIYGIKDHEKLGATFLRNNNIKYPIPELVENHVKVKKYLVYKNSDYFNNLSEASKKTLNYQGGKMTIEEATEFENDPLFKDSLILRHYDDNSKKVTIKLKSLDYYKEMLHNYLSISLNPP